MYTVTLLVVLCRNYDQLESESIKNQIGASYESLNVRERSRKQSIALIILRHLRIYGLSYVLTFAALSLLTQVFYIVASSLLLIGMIGLTRPFDIPT